MINEYIVEKYIATKHRCTHKEGKTETKKYIRNIASCNICVLRSTIIIEG